MFSVGLQSESNSRSVLFKFLVCGLTFVSNTRTIEETMKRNFRKRELGIYIEIVGLYLTIKLGVIELWPLGII